ncbi:hypothetical protein C4D60_Mb05t21300 [Musa balbisiana]|uniref:Uncharacterized protein n=1 Tax=Musa balbisiana TaxID=52838 RepID=A0A4S8JXS8_MUSBA|nr:hypothetical protein C4D60_Mb05t21300 [Musa balbisiana]
MMCTCMRLKGQSLVESLELACPLQTLSINLLFFFLPRLRGLKTTTGIELSRNRKRFVEDEIGEDVKRKKLCKLHSHFCIHQMEEIKDISNGRLIVLSILF